MDKKVLKWNFIFQYGWVLTNIFNSILLLPLYLRHIDVDTLGLWLATGSILAWMTMVDPGIGEVLQQRIAELKGKNENQEIGKTIGSGFMASAIILLISIAVGVACYLFAGHIINKNIGSYSYLPQALIVSVVATALSLVSFGMSGINQGMHNSAQVAIAALLANFLFLLVNLVLLYAGYGVLSIALANLCRAIFLNVYNIISMMRATRRQALAVTFAQDHFKKFIRIFSFTSASKIISGISYSVDMIVLARFLPAAMITTYEINKRPVNIAYSLIGRHCIALLPLISHAKGSGDKPAIVNLINKQFRLYSYAAMFAAMCFCFNYDDLITAWTNKNQFAGYFITALLVANMFTGLICYYIANIAYALGDIKMNSLYNIIRALVYAVVVYFAASSYGITGTLVASLALTLSGDVFFYSYRLHKLGYLDKSTAMRLLSPWTLVVPLGLICGLGIKWMVNTLVGPDMYFAKLFLNGGLFSLVFLTVLCFVDGTVRNIVKQISGKFIFAPLYRIIKT